MASAASPSTPSGGVSSSMWANQPPSRAGWGRNGEAGSAFRGISRGRPGRGGGGRGGRGGRGGSRVNGANPPRSDDKASKQNGPRSKEPPPATPTAVSAHGPIATGPVSDSTSPVVPRTSNNNRTRDAKPPARKVSEAKPPRKVPPIIIDPPLVQSSHSPVSATTPSRSRRKPQSRSASSIPSSKKSPSTESSTSHLRPDKSPVVTKDLPPHLAAVRPPETPSFDIKHDIDALVERVRAVAMDRPNTPGSHIDWAGEDDDSLPDLDDWGVKSVAVVDASTSSASVHQQDLISPILADALKPLPNIEPGSSLKVSSTARSKESSKKAEFLPPPSESVSKDAVGNDTPRGALKSKPSVQVKEKPPAIKAQSSPLKDRKKSDASRKPPIATAPTVAPATEKEAVQNSPSKQPSLPLHPSLPPKPVDAIDALSKRAQLKPNTPTVQPPDPAADVESSLKSGLSNSMHAPKPNGMTPPDISTASSPEPPCQGVAVSIHAPIHSAPSHITTHSTPSPSFQPTHGRAHTVGRPGNIRMPFSPSHGSFPDGQGGDERASCEDRINHARTHSSPPTGPGTSTAHSRTVHATRPVITVDALSRLARTLGGAPATKRESTTVAAAKD